MADVFVSYKREDAARVKKLVAALRQVGLDAWWDEDIAPSAPWEATIEKALRESKAVIVCWSPHAVASENVRSEARVAREDGRLIQVFMKPCSPPLFFGERQGVDLSSWRGKADDPRIAKIAESVRAVAAGQKPHVHPVATVRSWFSTRVHVAIAGLVLFAGSLAGWWLLSPAKAQGPQTLAVLPFRALNSADANLVDAIWDDTRGAISRNPNLRVLGRESVKALATRGLEPAEYRKKVGADYLLDGSVEHIGDQVRLKVSLTRTADGAEVWSDQVGGKLDDVFAFQQRVAREVEGRIRGRVAPGGGVVAGSIPTSPEAYAMFEQARALVLLRGNGHGAMGQARQLLRKVVAMDPNFAPAWAELGEALAYGAGGNTDQVKEAISAVQRALQLAPNLAHAHAVWAMVHNNPPELEGDLRKALQMDPNDEEGWNWLGACLTYQNRTKEALAAYSRSVEIEPLFWPSVGNKINLLRDLNDTAGLDAEVARAARIGDPVWLAKVNAGVASGIHPGEAVRILLNLKLQHADETGWIENHLGGPLIQLGFLDEAAVLWSWPPDVLATYRGNPGPPNILKWGYDNKATDFWQDGEWPAIYGRLLPRHGRLSEYHALYATAFKSPDELVALYPGQRFTGLAPTIAVNLRAAGDLASAQAILARADALIAGWLRNGPATGELMSQLAFLRAAEGNDDEAIKWLKQAVDRGGLPDRRFNAIDIADEPAFAHLVNRADFQALRQRILARIEEERRKVPLDLLHRAYPVPTNTKQIAA